MDYSATLSVTYDHLPTLGNAQNIVAKPITSGTMNPPNLESVVIESFSSGHSSTGNAIVSPTPEAAIHARRTATNRCALVFSL